MTSNDSKPVKYSIRLLNHPIYQDPDGVHTYLTVWEAPAHEVLHVPGCPELAKYDSEEIQERNGTYRQAMNNGLDHCQRCQPHGTHHVTLPDGTRRFAPMGPLFTGADADRYRHAEYALVEKRNGRWRVRRWAESAQAAVKLAVELGVPYVLGPRYDSLGLPTPIPEEDL
ncbi:hypothetical protein [Nonomuraea sp. NPDC050786]|uniref:hypothetical protein n=1 Tax=Nonomuraea sp. NPDC050786 TaxID=3154840 RepID=UPI00340736BB